MQPPCDLSLPFFSYGTLMPNEISYFRIKPFVERFKEGSVRGALFVRDGLLVADERGDSTIRGYLLKFKSGCELAAYQSIDDLEPSAQYRWGLTKVDGADANILWGCRPRKGSIELDFDWSSWDDPLFTTALDVVQELLDKHSAWDWNCENSFYLQMAYLLLWTSIERYASLRYHLKDKATGKVEKIAEEPTFASKLQELVLEKRHVQRVDFPERKTELDPNDPKKAIRYYYQIRSNLIHRGKGMPNDHRIIFLGCSELLEIFRHLLSAARADAEM